MYCGPGSINMQKKRTNSVQTFGWYFTGCSDPYKKSFISPKHMLWTHRGLSGPAILQISSYWQPDEPLTINLLPDQDALDIFQENSTKKITVKNLLSRYWPKRFAEVFCAHYLNNKPINQYTPGQREQIAHLVHHWVLIPQKSEGYAKAEITSGGIDTRELSSKTMETKRIPGLYFIGEVVDVTGHLGGFNFQWAWASGFCAGQYV